MDPNATVSQVVESVEKDLLGEIVSSLKRNKIDQAKAQSLAGEFLSYLPPKDFAGMIAILQKMSTNYSEARDVLIKYQGITQKSRDLAKAKLMAQHINEGNIEHAIKIAKGDTNES